MSNVVHVLSNQELFQAHKTDACYDLVAKSPPSFTCNKDGGVEYIEYKTDLFLDLSQENENPDLSPIVQAFVFPRSSISKYRLSLANSVGVIDNGYRGEVTCRFRYLHRHISMPLYESSVLVLDPVVYPEDIYQEGDRIAQIFFIFKPVTKILFKNRESFSSSTRGEGGYGSSGN